ncbi:MAG: Rpn family recombination-promoting nuclease/putative transposase, partial [Thermoanaerobaculia bacterium]
RRGELLPGDKLPPVLPILLYNGKKPWTAPQNLRELIAEAPPSLERYLPDLRYFLLDERRLPAADLSGEPNLVAGLVQLERSAGFEDVPQALEQMLPGIRGPEHRHVRRAIASWLQARLPEAGTPEDLLELTVMLEENVKKWKREWEEKGFRAGVERGLQQGTQRGEADLLLRQADRKFGGLDETQRARIESANAEQLLEWGERLLTARRPEDIFAT